MVFFEAVVSRSWYLQQILASSVSELQEKRWPVIFGDFIE
jgi:hypothetical protein